MSRAPDPKAICELALFGGLPEAGRKIFCDMVEFEDVAAGEVVFHEGDPASAIYVVVEGRVGVFKAHPDGERHLVDLNPGDFFGEMSFLDMQPRAGTVKSMEATMLWRWPYHAIREVYEADLKSYTLLVMNIAREVSRRLRRADEIIVHGK